MKLIQVLIILVLFFSCGGVVGTIKKYEFKESTLQELRSAVENVYKIDPKLPRNLAKPSRGLGLQALPIRSAAPDNFTGYTAAL